MQNTQIQKQHLVQPTQEDILVIPRMVLFQQTAAWHGINPTMFDHYASIIQNNATYMPRSHAETNPAYKQIIPYILFTYDQKLFMMQRKNSASEQRLASKFSLGIGGHIRQEDIVSGNILSWADREFEEEIHYYGAKSCQAIGVLNDDTSDVGQVHLGMIILMKGSNDHIAIRDEHKSGTLLTIDECRKLYYNMESWSQLCFDFIMQNQDLLK